LKRQREEREERKERGRREGGHKSDHKAG